MQTSDNTILITGGGSGIGRGLAEAFHQLGNSVIIAGRGRDKLDETVAANPGIEAMTFDIGQPDDIERFAGEVVAKFPKLNVVINNAGIMRNEDVKTGELKTAEATIATNLLGPIRLTAALLPHLLRQPRAAVMTVTSGLAYVPLFITPTYSATKAAIHSYTLSLREQLKDTAVEVIELIPPYVQTHLQGAQQANDPNAMPLDDYIRETMDLLTSKPDAGEIVVGRVERQRHAAERGQFDEVFEFTCDLGRKRLAAT